MFWNVPECSGMFHVPGFIDAPFYIISRAFVSCLGCQHFISDWLGKLKSSKLSTGCQNEFKGAAVEKATNPAGGFYFSRGFADRVPGSYKTAMLRRLRIMENYHAFISDIVFQHVIKSDHHTLHVAVILFWKEQR